MKRPARQDENTGVNFHVDELLVVVLFTVSR